MWLRQWQCLGSILLMATIHPSASFDEDLAAEALERAMRGFGTDKHKVVEILVRCNNAQRQMIRTPYKVRYGKDLEAELKRELSGDLEDAIRESLLLRSSERL
ncbi:Annexin, partial [Trichostrongylus colubriformis]